MPNGLGTAKKLWVLDAPTITFDQSLLNVGWSGPITMPLPAYLIEHPRGLVLFDTGVNPLAAEDPQGVYGPLAEQLGLQFTADQRIDRQLADRGYAPSDVKYVVASHAHFDHIGGLGMFPDAEVFIGHGDLQYAAYPDPLPSTFFLSEDIARVNPAQWREVHGDFDVFGDGSLVILATPGHSPGETSLLVRLPGRNFILAGDTVHLRHNLEHLLPMPFDVNNQQAVQSLRRLKMLMAANDATVWISHDPEDWAESVPARGATNDLTHPELCPETRGATVQTAMFQTPFMPPTRNAREVFTWAVDQAIACDQAGMSEYWVGEHASQSWECIPNPEIVIGAAALQTEQIVLAPGAHILPYHNPASTAIQIAWLSQILDGRYMLGVGAGAYPADGWIRGHKDLTHNHEMLLEALDILEKVWAGDPFIYEGKHFAGGLPEEDPGHPFRKMTPPGPIRLGLTGLSPNSESIRFAGQRGALPLSIYCGEEYVRNHWETYSTAAEAAGHGVDRSWHHVVRDVLVADTDAEAKRLAKEGGMGKAWGEYLLPIYSRFGILDGLIKHPGMAHTDIDLDYLAEHVWIVGSVDTVVEKFNEFQANTGGFGTIMAYGHDYIDHADAWNESLTPLAQEVAPRVTEGC